MNPLLTNAFIDELTKLSASKSLSDKDLMVVAKKGLRRKNDPEWYLSSGEADRYYALGGKKRSPQQKRKVLASEAALAAGALVLLGGLSYKSRRLPKPQQGKNVLKFPTSERRRQVAKQRLLPWLRPPKGAGAEGNVVPFHRSPEPGPYRPK
tara:strand:- start:157 stop:612 length:456 start_codon:yes stop_codon:yes gene_type:complete